MDQSYYEGFIDGQKVMVAQALGIWEPENRIPLTVAGRRLVVEATWLEVPPPPGLAERILLSGATRARARGALA